MVERYAVEFRPEARDSLGRLGKSIAQRILDKIKWLAENFDTIPHMSLSGEFRGLFKLRVGDYRVVYSVSRKEMIITILLLDHRREVYKRK